MKKQLLFGFAAIFALGANAQNARTIANPKIAKIKKTLTPKADELANPFTSVPNSGGTKKVMVGPYKRIAGSANVLGVQMAESRALQYNQAINTVGFVMRKQMGWTFAGPENNTGTICYAYSINGGTSWDSTIVARSSAYLHRYPGGSIFNPPANTNPSNAFAMASGPWHPGASWQGSYFAAKQFTFPGNNNNGVVVYSDNNALLANQRKQDFTRVDFQVTADGKAHVCGDIAADANGTTNAAYGWRGTMLNTGTHTGAGVFSWALDSLKPSFKVDGVGDMQGSTSYNNTWSEDGQTGYTTFYGVDINAPAGTSANSYQPYVYKTTNGGASWSRHAPLFDFSSIPSIADRLYPTRGVAGAPLLKAFIYPGEGAASTVDAAGNMHLICTMSSAISDHIDSLGYTYAINYNQVWNYIVDFKTTSTGWCATVLDSLMCEGTTSNASDPSGVGTSNWTSSGDPFAYDARCQISRTTDGNYIFYSWADSDTTIASEHVSAYPDIYMKGYDVANNKLTATKNMSRTKGGIEAFSYWHYLSTKALRPTGSTFNVPFTVTQSDDGSNDGDIAVSHYYVHDNDFSVSEFTVVAGSDCPIPTGIKNETQAVAGLNFYPNPASSNGTIEVVLNESAKMDVTIINNVGQTVYSTTVAGNAGSNKIDVNLSNLASGLYFYQVKIGNNQAITKKFAVGK